MKITETKQSFTPVTIQITFESQREIEFWYQFIGNTSAGDKRDTANIDNLSKFTHQEADQYTDPIYLIVKKYRSC